MMLKNIEVDIHTDDSIKIDIEYNDQLLSLVLTQKELEHLFKTLDAALMEKIILEERKNEY